MSSIRGKILIFKRSLFNILKLKKNLYNDMRSKIVNQQVGGRNSAENISMSPVPSQESNNSRKDNLRNSGTSPYLSNNHPINFEKLAMSTGNNQQTLMQSRISENRTSQQAREEFSRSRPIVSFSSPYVGKSPRISISKSKAVERISRMSIYNEFDPELSIALSQNLHSIHSQKIDQNSTNNFNNNTAKQVKDLQGFKTLQNNIVHPLTNPSPVMSVRQSSNFFNDNSSTFSSNS
jgi:hypothetical protein